MVTLQARMTTPEMERIAEELLAIYSQTEIVRLGAKLLYEQEMGKGYPSAAMV